MLKNKFRFTLKLFIIVWIVLFIHVVLKLSFNYWQPYVIPTEQLQIISDFIDNHRWIRDILDGLFYIINALFMILASIKRWWFKNKIQSIIVITIVILSYLFIQFVKQSDVLTIILAIGIPLILDWRKWFFTIITFALNNIFLAISFWLESLTNSNNMPYIVQTFFVLDYYIMLILNYFVFNLIKKGGIKNGKTILA